MSEPIAQEYTLPEQQQLLQLARAAVTHHLQQGTDLHVASDDFAPHLQEFRACFVSLTDKTRLRGCIGGLQATQPLVQAVALNACNAAFRDCRFAPVKAQEFARLTIHIAVLNPMEPMACTSREDLLCQLRPGVDGLFIEEGCKRGTFLPAVWESLPNRQEFLQQLLLKAALPPDYWSDGLQIHRYTCSSFAE